MARNAAADADRSGKTRRIGGLDVLAVSAGDAVAEVVAAVRHRQSRIFAFCNAHTANTARGDPAFRVALTRTTLFNDGIGVDLASRILHGTPFPDNLNGTDLTPAILAALPPQTRIFLVGSRPGVAEQARAILAVRHPHLVFVGAQDGFFKREEEPALAARIADANAAVVLVGMGHPHQELWAARNVERLGAVLLCIGAFLDFTARVVPRAPAWMRRARIEWGYRLLKEPRRMARRYLIGNLAFMLAVLRERAGRA